MRSSWDHEVSGLGSGLLDMSSGATGQPRCLSRRINLSVVRRTPIIHFFFFPLSCCPSPLHPDPPCVGLARNTWAHASHAL